MNGMYFVLCNRYMPQYEECRKLIMEQPEQETPETKLPTYMPMIKGCAEHYVDKTKAKAYYEEALKNENEYTDDTVNNLGYLYLEQYMFATVATKYFIISAKSNNEYAINNLANAMYMYGNDKHKLYAIQLYKKIYKTNTVAAYSLGVLSMREGKIDEAITYFTESGIPASDYKLAIIYTSKKYKKHNNYDTGVKHIHYAVKYNYPYSYSVSGDIYYEGNCCERDLAKAFEYYIKAIEQKDYSPCDKLFEMYIMDNRDNDAIDILQKGIDNTKDKKLLGEYYNKLGLYYSQKITNKESRDKYEDLAHDNLQCAIIHENLNAEYNMANFLIKKIATPESIRDGYDMMRNYRAKINDLDTSRDKRHVYFQ